MLRQIADLTLMHYQIDITVNISRDLSKYMTFTRPERS